MKSLVFCIFFVNSMGAFAAEEAVYASLGIGGTIGTHTDSTTTGNALFGSSSSDEGDETSGYAELEIGIMDQQRSLGIMYSAFTYTYASGPPHDEMSQVLINYRQNLSPQLERVKIWLGFGAGLSILKIGQNSSTSGTTKATLQDDSKNTLLLQARLGAEYKLNDKFLIGFNVSYSHTQFNTVADLTSTSDGSSFGQLTTKATRTWGAGAVSLTMLL